MKNRSKTNRSKTNRSKTNKIKKKSSKTTRKIRYEIRPIYGGTSSINKIVGNKKVTQNLREGLGSLASAPLDLLRLKPKTALKNTAKGIYETSKGLVKLPVKLASKTLYNGVYSPLKYVGKKSLGLSTAPIRSFGRNTGTAFNNLRGNTTGGPNGPMDITHSIGSLGKSVMSGLTNMGKEHLTKKEKENVIKALGYLKENSKISEDAYAHAIHKINQKDGVLGIADSVVSIMSPIQGVVKVIGDWLVPVNPNDLHGRTTLVKVLQFPKASKGFVKESLGKYGKDVELDENMVLIKDFFPGAIDKLKYDLNSADNYIANAINGCLGPGCSNGVTHITPGLSHEIDITNNTSMKKILKEIREKEELDRMDAEEEAALQK